MASISDERGWTQGAGLQPRCAAGRRAKRGGQGPRAAGSTQTAPRAPEVSPAPSLGVGVRSGPDTWTTVRGTLGSRCLLDLKQSRALFSVTEALGAFCVAEPVAPKARGDPRNQTPHSWDLGAASANRRPWASTTRSEAARFHFQSHSHLVSLLPKRSGASCRHFAGGGALWDPALCPSSQRLGRSSVVSAVGMALGLRGQGRAQEGLTWTR